MIIAGSLFWHGTKGTTSVSIRLVRASSAIAPSLLTHISTRLIENCDLARAIAENRISRSVLEPDPNKLKRTFHDFSDSSSQGDNDDASTNASPQKKLTKKAARALEVEERKRVRLENKARKEQEAAEAKGRRKKGEPTSCSEGFPCSC